MSSSFSYVFSIVKKFTPNFSHIIIRRLFTSILTPIMFSFTSGHFKSSMAEKAILPNGDPLPWLTYPLIEVLKFRDLTGAKILEFGGGQSILFFSSKTKKILTFEGSKDWAQYIDANPKCCAKVIYIDKHEVDEQIASIKFGLKKESSQFKLFDIILIDALQREAILDFVADHLSKDGIIIYDNAESYLPYHSTLKKLKNLGFMRADFYGHAPGVINRHCTSVFLGLRRSFLTFLIQLKIFPTVKDNNFTIV